MSNDASMFIHAKWREAEPSGATCCVCKDSCFLSERRLWLKAIGQDDFKTEMACCGACWELSEMGRGSDK